MNRPMSAEACALQDILEGEDDDVQVYLQDAHDGELRFFYEGLDKLRTLALLEMKRRTQGGQRIERGYRDSPLPRREP